MSNGVRISADTANSAVGADLAERLSAKVTTGAADIALVSAPPTEPATHVVVTGGISEAVDEWDRAVAPQTVAGALWITSGQDAALAAAAWWVLRNQTPTTPLSDLTDTNERCLRWSVLGVTVVALTEPGEVTVDHEKIRAELDEAPEIQDLGKAIDRIGGDTADQVLASVDGFRAALAGLDDLATTPPLGSTPTLDTAIAEHLRQVQRSGFGRWRAAKARAQSQSDLVSAAKSVAADRLREVIAARETAELEQLRASAQTDAASEVQELVTRAAATVELPVVPDFDQVPRSWATDAPAPRRYVLVAQERADEFPDVGEASVRASEHVPADEVWCMVIQSGFSLPALQDS